MPARSYGGLVESLYRLCLGVAAVGCEVRVLTTNSDGIGRTLGVDTGRLIAIAAGLEVRYLPRLGRHAVAPSMLPRLVREVRRADVVHLTGVYSFPTIPTLFTAAMLRKPLVWSPHGALQRWAGSRRVAAKRLWELACLPLAGRRTVLHFTSERERIESQRRFPQLGTAVIPNGIRLPQEPAFNRADSSLRMGFIGRLDPKKGLENLLDACAMVKADGISFTLAIAGGGPERYVQALRSQAATLGLDSEVRFLGEVHNRAKRAFFEGINLMVVPSYTENFALVVAEALASGIPVIASQGTPWAEVEEKGCGLWVKNEPADLARAIQRMRDASLAVMGARGREWMAVDFSWSGVARAMCNTYSSLVYGKRLFDLDEGETAGGPGRAA